MPHSTPEAFRALAELNPVGILHGTVDGHVRFCNDAYCRITGRSREDFESGRVGWIDITPPEWIPVDVQAIEAVGRTGHCAPYEKEYVRPDGTRVPVLVGFSLFGESRTETAAFVLDLTERRAHERALRASEEQLQAALDASRTGTFRWDIAGGDLEWDLALRRLFGVPDAHRIASLDDFLALVHPDDRADVVQCCTRCRDEGADFDMSFRVVLPDGSLRWLYDRGRTLFDAHGRPAYMTGACVDVTDQRIARERLEENDARLRLAVEAAGLGWWTWDLVTGVSSRDARCAAMLGVAPDAQAPEVHARMHPDDLPRVRAELARALEHGRFHVEFRVPGADGGTRWIQGLGDVVRAADGRVIRLSGINQDITDRKTAQEEIARHERELQALADNSPDLLARFDRQGRCRFVNDAAERVTGLPAPAFLGRTLRELALPPAMCEAFEDALARVFVSGETASATFVLGEGESRRHYVARFVPERDARGGLVTAIGVAHDRTAEQAMEDARRDADRRKDQFLATLAHELRNPLAPLRSGLQVMAHDPSSPDARRVVAMMQRQLTHMVRLVDDLLDVSRIASGKILLRTADMPLREAAELALEATRPLVDAAGHSLVVEWPDATLAPLVVHGDATRLAQVIGNLLANAAKYTPPGGHLALSLRREGDEAVVAVTDDGLGIPEGMHEAIFEMFSQVNHTLERSQGGLGLGLTLVRALVERHAGQVTVHSDGEGRGSRFEVRLPLAAASLPGPAAPIAAPLPATSHAAVRRRILAVDDNRDALESFAMMLELLGHEVATAPDGPAALERAAAFRPDLAFLDIGMAGMSGYDVARALRGRRRPRR